MAGKKFLDNVYGLKTVAETRALYDDWSSSYDQEVAENGYATPGRIASALAGLIPDKSMPILDFGCGTGISGAALAAVGFSVIDGCDLSGDMLAIAGTKHAYRKQWRIEAVQDLAMSPGDYGAITAVGVISIGAAPPETLETLIDALAPDGLLAFSFNAHTLQDHRFADRVQHHLDCGNCLQILRQDGEHLPGINLRSTIYVLNRR